MSECVHGIPRSLSCSDCLAQIDRDTLDPPGLLDEKQTGFRARFTTEQDTDMLNFLETMWQQELGGLDRHIGTAVHRGTPLREILTVLKEPCAICTHHYHWHNDGPCRDGCGCQGFRA